METAVDYKVLYEEQKKLNEELQLTIASLRYQLDNLKTLIFGSKTERFVPQQTQPTSQLALDIEAQAVAAVKITDARKIEYTRVQKEVTATKPHPGRHKLPEHLERRETIIQPEGSTEGLKKIGEEITEELEYEPGNLFVNRYVRPKYAKPGNEGIVVAPMVERPLPKAIAGAGLLAQIIIDKYVDHLPLYRQMQRFNRQGMNLPYSTITDWVKGSCGLILPLYEAHKKIILQTGYLNADETPKPVLDKNKEGGLHRGYFWVYLNAEKNLVLFEYQPGRGREGPEALLKDFKGYLQTDGYIVYDYFKDKEGIIVLHCMAHARRMFYESLANDKARAEYVLEQMGVLYSIERKARDESLSFEQVYALRQAEALPVLKQLGEWLQQQYVQVLPKSPIGKAIGYSLERWKELMIYATDGKLKIDNNPVENSIRPAVLGRKNYLFAGSHEAAQRSAMLYSLVNTCKMHNINSFVYLRDVLQRISTHPVNQIEELLPQNWKLRGGG